MSEVDLLQDYRTIYQTILGPITNDQYSDVSLENLTANQINIFTTRISETQDNLNNATLAFNYINSIKTVLSDLSNLPTGQDDEEDLDYDEKSKLQLKEETIKRKRRSLRLLQLSLILIFGGLGMFILIKTFRNFSKNRKSQIKIKNANSLIEHNEEKQAVYYSLIDNICYSLVLFYIVYLVRFNFKYYIELINLEYDNYKSVKNIEIKNIHSSLTDIKSIVDKIVCIRKSNCGNSSSSTTTSTEAGEKAMTEYYNTRGSLASYIIIFNDNYLKLDKALIDNKLAKEEKIQDINVIFNNYKDIIYKENNRFDNIVVDNEKHVVCLMNILLYKGNNDNVSEDIVCNLNNSDGLRGLIEKNKINPSADADANPDDADAGGGADDADADADDADADADAGGGADADAGGGADEAFEADATNTVMLNGLENIGVDAADGLYELFTGNTLDESNKFELLNNPLFNVILNIFKMKIYKYNIKKHDFIVYIYSHFENMDLEKNNITEIGKFDIINNYKTIINIIYSEYETYKKLQVTNKNIPRYQISLNKFNEIVEHSTIQNIKDTNTLLLETKKKLEYFKKLHGGQIYNDIRKEQRFNKSLEYFTYLSLFITILQLIKVIYTKKFKDDFVEDAIDVTKYISFALLFNAIVLSYWYRKTTNTDYSEMLIRNNDNIFKDELDILNKHLEEVITIKGIGTNTGEELTTLLNKYNISKGTNNNEVIYSQNIGGQYIILEERDVKNMVYEDYYVQLTRVIHIHECCSFLTRKKKIPVFPWTDFTVNLIFYIIIFLIVFNIFLINDDLNPFAIVNNLKNRLLVNRTDIGKLKNIIDTKKISLKLDSNLQQKGGEYKAEVFKQKNLVNLLVIYLSLLYTYKIYESTFNYNDNLFK